LEFFDRELENKDILTVFKKYIARLIPGLIGAALHPLIHIGYALEFNSKPVLSEGLAYACMAYNELGSIVDNLDESLATPSKSARELLKTIDALNPPDLLHAEGNFGSKVATAARLYAPQIKELLSKWEFDPQDPEALYRKMVDLTLTSVLGFCGSYRESTPDFFYAHGVTGVHAIRTLLPHLQPNDQRRLLQIGFLAMTAFYLTRGPVEFDEHYVYKAKENGRSGMIPSEGLDWKELFEMANDSSDDHLIKIVRALHVTKETITESPESNYPKNLNIEGARLVVGTIRVEQD